MKVVGWSFLFLGLSVTAWAEIAWKTQTVYHDADLLEPSFTATFPFEVTGDTPVSIIEVKSSCGCTTPDYADTAYQPGETGEIKATFTYGNRVGRHTKTINVRTSGSDTWQELKMEVSIPRALSVRPRALQWEQNSPGTARRIHVRFNEKLGMQIGDIAVTSDLFEFERDTSKEGHWVLNVKPVTTDASSSAFLQVESVYPDGRSSKHRIFLQIRPQKGPVSRTGDE